MANTPGSFDTLRDAKRTGRKIAVDGVTWRVYEVPGMGFDRRHNASLVFESDSAFRRVRHFPQNWRELNDEDLFALSWST